MVIRASVRVVAVALGLVALHAPGQGTTNKYTFTHAGYTRTYSVYLPSTCSPTNPSPLVLQLTPNAAIRPALYSMNRVADREAFLVAYPDPFGDNWMGPARTDPYDDVGFLLEVIHRISTDYSVKAAQIYAGGYSAGGIMGEYLGRMAPYQLAAVASVAGVRPYVQGTTNYMPLGSPATPCRPFPFLHIHGTADTIVPYGGGYSQGWNWPPVERVVGDYVSSNGCALTPSTTNLPSLDLTDGCTIQLLSYTNGHMYLDTDGNAREAQVLFYRVVGGGHSWPGDYQGWGALFPWAFPVNRDIDASEEIWTFFSRHRVAAAPPGRFDGLLYSTGEGFQCTFRDAAVGQRYRIQMSASMLPGSWTDLTNVTYTGPIVIKDGGLSGPGMKFYRAVCP
jgi:polyhydroxybutyrate depolymerase